MPIAKQNKIEQVKHTMELDERIDLHIRGWKAQRIGWLVILSLMLAAALGVFGEGIVSKKRVDLENAQVKYDRFFRYEAEMVLQFTIAESSDSTLISFDQQYLKNLRIMHIVPEPEKNFTRAGKVYYVFNGSSPMSIAYYMVPEQPGSLKGEVEVNYSRFYLSHFIYP